VLPHVGTVSNLASLKALQRPCEENASGPIILRFTTQTDRKRSTLIVVPILSTQPTKEFTVPKQTTSSCLEVATMTDLDRTPIGVRLGEITLYTASPIDLPTWRGACRVSSGDLRTQLGQLRDRACRRRRSACAPIDTHVERRRDAIVARIDDAAREICEFASAYAEPVLVTGDGHVEADLRRWLIGPGPRCGRAWLLPTAHERLRSIAAERSIPTATVPIAYSARECYACGVLGDRVVDDEQMSAPDPDAAVVRCPNPDCPVDRVHAGSNSAVVLAQRYRSGKRCRYQPSRSDGVNVSRLRSGGGE